MTSRALAKYSDEQIIDAIRDKMGGNILLFGSKCITEDQHDPVTPWKPLPVKDIQYVQDLLESYVTDTKILVVKSRQVMVSWIYVIACFWDILFHKGKKIAFVSKKLADAQRLVDRAKFVWEQLPDWKPHARFVSHPYPKIEVPSTRSTIHGFPQGAEQVRGDTFSTILSDEFAFQEQQEKTYVASRPTVDGGGKFIAVSTPNGQTNLFYKLTKDSSFTVHRIHYSMNPFKGDEWRKEAFKDLSEEAIQQEYELNFLATNASRITAEFNPQVHVRPLSFNPHRPLYVCWDFGYNRPAVVFIQEQDDRVFILRSLLGYKEVIEQFGNKVLAFQAQNFPEVSEVVDYCDIAGTYKNDRAEKSSAQVLSELLAPYGRRLQYKKTKNLEDGYNAMRKKMNQLVNGLPAWNVDPSNPLLIEGFQGGMHYHGKAMKICGCGINEFGQDEKDFFKHQNDCVRYFVENFYGINGKSISTPMSAVKGPLGVDKRFNPQKPYWE